MPRVLDMRARNIAMVPSAEAARGIPNFPPMGAPSRIHLILFYHAYNAYSLNVLGGAVDQAAEQGEFPPGAVETSAVAGLEALHQAIAARASAGVMVVVGWSFYSPESGRAFAQLREVKAAVPP